MTTRMNVIDTKVMRTLSYSWLPRMLLVPWLSALQLVPSESANVPHSYEFFPSLLSYFLGTHCTHKGSINSFDI